MTDETRPYRAMIVERWGRVSWDDWIRLSSRADDGRDPTEAR